ncbi:MAG: hypothetical protein ACQETE_01645 [Bacteroidota bacterium]
MKTLHTQLERKGSHLTEWDKSNISNFQKNSVSTEFQGDELNINCGINTLVSYYDMNAAERIHSLLLEINHHSTNKSAEEGWSDLFNISSVGLDRHQKVVAIIDSLRIEINKLDAQCEQNNISEKLYKDNIKRLKRFIEPKLLSKHWSETKKIITPELLVALENQADRIGEIEPVIETDELNTAINQINNFLSELYQSKMDESLIQFIADILNHIKISLMKAKINGVEIFGDSIKSIIGKLMAHPEFTDVLKDAKEGTNKNKFWTEITSSIDWMKTQFDRGEFVGRVFLLSSRLGAYLPTISDSIDI